MIHFIYIVLTVWLTAMGVVRSGPNSLCPNGCSSHGVCANSTDLTVCQCFPSFTGIDCSLRVCPSARAWVDVPSDDETAHARYTECSNMV